MVIQEVEGWCEILWSIRKILSGAHKDRGATENKLKSHYIFFIRKKLI